MPETSLSERGSVPASGDPFEGTAYRAVERLAGGGMGEVFKVEHRLTGRTLVAKVLHDRLSYESQFYHRFRIEAQALAQLKHAHVVQIIGYESTRDGRPFIVTEYLSGRTLAEELHDGHLTIEETLTFAAQLLAALGAAHALGIVHRDVKPENLLICRRENGPRYLKVIDFGVARLIPGISRIEPIPFPLKTATGALVGTPRFTSPEAALGEVVDHRSDLYAASLVLYAMLAERGPFDDLEGNQPYIAAHAFRVPAPPSMFAEELVPRELDRAILRGLEKDPAQRFQSAEEFREELLYVASLLHLPAGWLETMSHDVPEHSVVDDEENERENTSPLVIEAQSAIQLSSDIADEQREFVQRDTSSRIGPIPHRPVPGATGLSYLSVPNEEPEAKSSSVSRGNAMIAALRAEGTTIGQFLSTVAIAAAGTVCAILVYGAFR